MNEVREKTKPLIVAIAVSAILVVAACSFVGIPLWKNSKFNSERLARLNEYYSRELSSSYYCIKATVEDVRQRGFSQTADDWVGWYQEQIEKAKVNMANDGYNQAEISDMSKKAENEATNRLKLEKDSAKG